VWSSVFWGYNVVQSGESSQLLEEHNHVHLKDQRVSQAKKKKKKKRDCMKEAADRGLPLIPENGGYVFSKTLVDFHQTTQLYIDPCPKIGYHSSIMI
jgi:hypothetical protein